MFLFFAICRHTVIRSVSLWDKSCWEYEEEEEEELKLRNKNKKLKDLEEIRRQQMNHKSSIQNIKIQKHVFPPVRLNVRKSYSRISIKKLFKSKSKFKLDSNTRWIEVRKPCRPNNHKNDDIY